MTRVKNKYNIEVAEVDSSAITEVKYDPNTSVLEVQFNHGSRYAYDNVPRDIWYHLHVAPSIGRFFNTHIRDQYEARRVR